MAFHFNARSLANLKPPQAEDLTGRVYGMLTVIAKGATRKRHNTTATRTFWVCKCTCGKEVEKATDKLKEFGGKRGCGECLSVFGPYLPPGEQGLRSLFGAYRSAAKAASKEFTLTQAEFKAITSSNCHYCGVAPTQLRTVKDKAYTTYAYNGIDRVDNDRGYVQLNCVPCCSYCNIMKKDFTYAEFLERISRINGRLN